MTRTVGLCAAAALAAVALGVTWRSWAAPDDPKREKFAQDKTVGNTKAKDIPFDGDRAMKYLKQLIDLGPRVSGSEPMKKQQELVIAHFEKYGATVTKQPFEAKQYSRKEKVGMVNLIAAWHPERAKRVILCTHYDTRPMAHEDDRKNWNKRFDSANDGTSGVAMLMELAHHMKELPTAYGVDFVLFDGEEYIFEPGGAMGGGDRFFFGSEHFAEEYKKNVTKLKYRYEGAILYDLFAHPGAVFRVEGNSFAGAPQLVKDVWDVAAAVGAKSFVWEAGGEVLDDHLALNRAGIPAIDVIDFDGYHPHWHKLSDTADKCSAKQMAEVARVTTAWLQLIR